MTTATSLLFSAVRGADNDEGFADDDAKNLEMQRPLPALITDRVATGVVYTTFHHPMTQANVITTDFSDWATNCPEYKVTAVEVSRSNGPTQYQETYEEFSDVSRRIAPAEAAE